MRLSETQYKIKHVYEQMYGYQKDVFTDMVRRGSWYNCMEPGMGKTLTTMTASLYLQGTPGIIVCPKSAMGVWKEELQKWFGLSSLVYVGKPKERDAILKEFARSGTSYIITNYALLKELSIKLGLVDAKKVQGSSNRGSSVVKQTPPPGTQWVINTLIADEVQRAGIFNHKTDTYKLFKQLTRTIPHRFLLTGTPYRKGVVDFFGPLSIVAPEDFDSYWKYVEKHCMKFNSGFGVDIDRNPKDAEAFRAMLKNYASVLRKKDHLKDLPEKIRQPIILDMDPEQERHYRELEQDLYTETDSGDIILVPSGLALLVRARQLLACPQQLGLATRGAALDFIMDDCSDFVDEKQPFVIFTPFRVAIPWIQLAIHETYRGSVDTYVIEGGLTAEQFEKTWQTFQQTKSTKARVLICVIKSSASFHATVADTCYFLGCEWDFNENVQAEDRLNRIGQKNVVHCKYMTYRNTVDEAVLQRLNEKQFGADLILTPDSVFKQLIARRRALAAPAGQSNDR